MISRAPEAASGRAYDVVIIGGGVLGACHALEATRRNLSVLLLERDDFGGATSWSSHRIVHGGLRYVQSLDFTRQTESIRERRWFLRSFGGNVRPLPCLMPLYNRGLKRLSTFRAAFLINDTLSARRNDGLAAEQQIPAGRVVSRKETQSLFPQVEQAGLKGGALWHDGILQPPQRVLVEILRWAASGGAVALNYVPATSIASTGDGFVVSAIDRVSGRALEFRTAHVINCAGSWAAGLHVGDQPAPPLSLAFSVILDRPALSQAAVAVSPRQAGDPMCFLVPLHGRILAGTCHLPWQDGLSRMPTDAQISDFLRDVNESVPGLEARASDVVRVFAGLLPAVAPGSGVPSGRPACRLHPSSTASHQFMTIWGVKYTTARSAAEATMRRMFPPRAPGTLAPPAPVAGLDFSNWVAPAAADREHYRAILQRIQREESVICLEDLLLRRTDWGIIPSVGASASAEIGALLDLAFESVPAVASVPGGGS